MLQLLSYTCLTLGVVIILILISWDPVFLKALSSLDNSHKTNIRILAANDTATVNVTETSPIETLEKIGERKSGVSGREVVEREETGGEALGCGLSEKL